MNIACKYSTVLLQNLTLFCLFCWVNLLIRAKFGELRERWYPGLYWSSVDIKFAMAGLKAGGFLLTTVSCRPLSYCYVRRIVRMMSRHEARFASCTVLQALRTGQADCIGLRLPPSCSGQCIRPFQTDNGTIVIQEGGEREIEVKRLPGAWIWPIDK